MPRFTQVYATDNHFYCTAISVSGKDERNSMSWLGTQASKVALSCTNLSSFFFLSCECMDCDSVSFHKHAKRTWPILGQLDLKTCFITQMYSRYDSHHELFMEKYTSRIARSLFNSYVDIGT